MSFSVSPITLEGRSVRLEPLSHVHVDGLFEIGRDDDDWRYLPRPCFSSRDDASGWVQEALALQEQGLHCPFVQVDREAGAIMGSTRYLNIRPRDRGLEIGYTWLAGPWQRTAANTEAKFLLLQHAFEHLGAWRVELKTDARNERSQRAIERIGGVREGVFRRHMLTRDGHVRDSVYYSVTDQEWPGVRERLQGMMARP